jgi:hypothetical protein
MTDKPDFEQMTDEALLAIQGNTHEVVTTLAKEHGLTTDQIRLLMMTILARSYGGHFMDLKDFEKFCLMEQTKRGMLGR